MRKSALVLLLWLGLLECSSAQPENLAWKRIASSSNETETNQAQAAVDGDRRTVWSSGVSGDQYLYVDLDAPCHVTEVDLMWGPHCATHQLQVSMDAAHWRTLSTSGRGGTEHFALATTTRYVRVFVPQVSSRVELAELEVHGTCDTPRPSYVGQTFPRLPKRAHVDAAPQLDGRLVLNTGWEMDRDTPDAQAIQAGLDTRTWYDATVPGTVLTTLVNEHVLPEPLYGLNNRRIDESYNKSVWWYRNSFVVPPTWQDKRVWLDFGGINWKADVWLNGTKVGNIAGAFTRGHFDVTSAVNLTGRNVLAVKIYPNHTPGWPLEQTVTAGTGANGGKLGADNPTFHATVGWDWIPGIRDRSIGIWQPVSLRATGPAVIADPQVVTTLPLPDISSANLTVKADVQNASQEPLEGTLTGTLDDNTTFSAPVSLAPGEHKTVAFPEQTVVHPRLWWPNGYGPQNLYTLHLRLQSFDGTTWDTATTHFGVRQMGYDDNGHELIITVNGRKIFCKGGNWGMDEAMKRIPHHRLDAFIHMHQLAHVTMIRNWIGMSSEEDFYDLCDRYGILIWNDFWLANPVDGPDPDDPDMFLANAADAIKHFRNHPSIALWCGRNEGVPPPQIHAGLQRLIADLDGTRRYQSGSDRDGVHGHGPYCYQDPARYFYKLAHGFTTEIGLPSVPSVESLLHTMPLQDLWPINDTWAYHDFCHGAQNPHTYLAAMADRYGRATDIEDFCRKAQMLNYDTYRAVFEAWNHKLWKDCSGVLLWMSHPSWPSTVWQLYDYDLEPTAALYGVQKGCEPVHVQLNLDDNSVSVINNSFEDLREAHVTTEVYRLTGQPLWHSTTTTTAAANASTDCGQLPRQGLPAAYFVHLVLADASGSVRSDNFYWHAAHEQDLQALNRLPIVAVHGQATAVLDDRGTVTVTATLHNQTPHVAVMVNMTLRGSSSGLRILPAFCSENYVSLLPGESRTVTIECDQADLHGETPMLALEGWNIRRGTIAITSP